MLIGSFGTKRFEVSPSRVITFDSLDLSGSLSTSTQDAAGKKPVTAVKGPSLTKISLTLKLNAALGADVQAEIDSWLALMEAGRAYPFVLCGRAVGANRFLLTSCKAGEFTIGQERGRAAILAAELALEFCEYLPPGAQPAFAGGTGGGAAEGGLSAANPYRMPSAAEKAGMKRENPGMGGS